MNLRDGSSNTAMAAQGVFIGLLNKATYYLIAEIFLIDGFYQRNGARHKMILDHQQRLIYNQESINGDHINTVDIEIRLNIQGEGIQFKSYSKNYSMWSNTLFYQNICCCIPSSHYAIKKCAENGSWYIAGDNEQDYDGLQIFSTDQYLDQYQIAKILQVVQDAIKYQPSNFKHYELQFPLVVQKAFPEYSTQLFQTILDRAGNETIIKQLNQKSQMQEQQHLQILQDQLAINNQMMQPQQQQMMLQQQMMFPQQQQQFGFQQLPMVPQPQPQLQYTNIAPYNQQQIINPYYQQQQQQNQQQIINPYQQQQYQQQQYQQQQYQQQPFMLPQQQTYQQSSYQQLPYDNNNYQNQTQLPLQIEYINNNIVNPIPSGIIIPVIQEGVTILPSQI